MTDYQKLTQQFESSSAGSIVSTALSSFGNDIAIGFSGSEDVILIELAKQSGQPFRVFSLDTGRLHPETYRYFATIEQFYSISIEYCFPDSDSVQKLVRKKGLFSFFEDGHQECCGIRKVAPLRRHLSGLGAWITGQRRDQNPQTRKDVPIVHVDQQFRGLNDTNLIKWNPLATMTSVEVWDYIRAFNVPINPLHERGFVSIGCEPCSRPITPGQHERDGRWWWEQLDSKECGLHTAPIPSHELVD